MDAEYPMYGDNLKKQPKQNNISEQRRINTLISESLKNKNNCEKKVKKYNRQIREEENKIELLDFYIKVQVPIGIATLAISLLAGGLSTGLAVWIGTALLQTGTAMAAIIAKDKHEPILIALEMDRDMEEYNSHTYQREIDKYITTLNNLSNPIHDEKHAAASPHSFETEEIFSVINGHAVKVDKPPQYIKRIK